MRHRFQRPARAARTVHEDEHEEDDEPVVVVPKDLELAALDIVEHARVDEQHGQADQAAWVAMQTRLIARIGRDQ